MQPSFTTIDPPPMPMPPMPSVSAVTLYRFNISNATHTMQEKHVDIRQCIELKNVTTISAPRRPFLFDSAIFCAK